MTENTTGTFSEDTFLSIRRALQKHHDDRRTLDPDYHSNSLRTDTLRALGKIDDCIKARAELAEVLSKVTG